MKKLIAIILCFICYGGSVCYAQDIVKELKEENDGFKWFRLKQDKYYGATDLNGKTLIPLSKKYVSLWYSTIGNQDRGFFNVKDENYYWGLFEKNGREIISTEKGYDMIVYQITNEGYKFFEVHKDNTGKQGICDLTGKELIPPQSCDAIIYSDDNFKILSENGSWKNTGIKLSQKDPLNSNSSFKQLETEGKSGFKWYRVHKGDYIGAESADGKQLIPAKYESVEYKCNDNHSNDLPYFEVKKKGAIGVYDLTGKILIPIERNYDYIGYESSDEHPYFLVKKNKKKGACDLSGKEVISPIYYYVHLSNYGFTTQLSEDAEEKKTDIKINSKGLWVDNANPTDANHQYELGVKCFTKGDLKEAVKWFKKSSAQGYLEAYFFLGLCYERGQGVDKDINEALSWYRKAQQQGHIGANERIEILTKPVTITPPKTSTTPKSVAPNNTAPRTAQTQTTKPQRQTSQVQKYHDALAFELLDDGMKECKLKHEYYGGSAVIVDLSFLMNYSETYKFSRDGQLTNAAEIGITNIQRNKEGCIISYKKDDCTYKLEYESLPTKTGINSIRLKRLSWGSPEPCEYRYVKLDDAELMSGIWEERHYYKNGKLEEKEKIEQRWDENYSKNHKKYFYFFPATEKKATEKNIKECVTCEPIYWK